MKKVDLNVDIGEGFAFDEALLEFATSANVCCGEHAGSWELTEATVALCERKGKRYGAHPGFPDRESMGRVLPHTIPDEWLFDQVEQVGRFVSSFPAKYFKPHGAWYQALTDSSADIDFASTEWSWEYCLGIVGRFKIPAMLLADAPIRDFVGRDWSIAEGFADRAYRPDGTLVPRSEPGAVLHDSDEIKYQVLHLAPKVDSICLHGDTPNCLEFAEMVYKTLVDHGYEVGY